MIVHDWINAKEHEPLESMLVFIEKHNGIKVSAYYENGFFWKIEGCCCSNFREPIQMSEIKRWRDARFGIGG